MPYYKATQRVIRADGRRERGDVWRASLSEKDRGILNGHIEVLEIPEGVIIVEEESLDSSETQEGA